MGKKLHEKKKYSARFKRNIESGFKNSVVFIFSFIDLSEELLHIESNQKESRISSSIELNRSFMHSILKNEKCDLDDSKRGTNEFFCKKSDVFYRIFA